MLQDVPLDAPPEQVLKLWEILFSDLEAKFAGELHAQRFVLGVVTEKNVDLARAIAGERGAVHAGAVTEAHLIDWARRNAAGGTGRDAHRGGRAALAPVDPEFNAAGRVEPGGRTGAADAAGHRGRSHGPATSACWRRRATAACRCGWRGPCSTTPWRWTRGSRSPRRGRGAASCASSRHGAASRS